MIERNGETRFPPQQVATDVSQFAHDIVALAELQVDLLKVDATDGLKRLAVSATLLILALIVSLGSVPILLAALALGLMTAGLNEWLAFLSSAGIGLVVATILTVIAWRGVRHISNMMERSRTEFRRNVEWIKHVLSIKRDAVNRRRHSGARQ